MRTTNHRALPFASVAFRARTRPSLRKLIRTSRVVRALSPVLLATRASSKSDSCSPSSSRMSRISARASALLLGDFSCRSRMDSSSSTSFSGIPSSMVRVMSSATSTCGTISSSSFLADSAMGPRITGDHLVVEGHRVFVVARHDDDRAPTRHPGAATEDAAERATARILRQMPHADNRAVRDGVGHIVERCDGRPDARLGVGVRRADVVADRIDDDEPHVA